MYGKRKNRNNRKVNIIRPEMTLAEENDIRRETRFQDSMAAFVALALRVFWILLILLITFRFVLGITVNRDEAMMPAFHDRDILIYYRLAHELVSGDPVVYLDDDGSTRLGRVVAIGGDTVDFSEEGLRVNGFRRLDDQGTGEPVLYEEGPSYPLALTTGEFFVLCDDRTQGKDSRLYGVFTEKDIRGRVLLSVRHRNF